MLRGDVESLTVAQQAGVGVRVVRDGRQGYAWAGALDPSLLDETLAEARDNVRFAAPDPSVGLPTPAEADGTPPEGLELWRDALLSVPTGSKVDLTLALEAATVAADPRVRGVESADYHDTAVEAAVASSLGVLASTRRTACSCSATASGQRRRRDAHRLRVLGRAFGGRARRRGRGTRRGRSRRAAPRGGSAPHPAPPRRLGPPRHRVGAQRRRRRAERRGGAEGPLDVRRAGRRGRGRLGVHARRRPDRS